MKIFLIKIIILVIVEVAFCAPNQRFVSDSEMESAITTRVIDLNNPDHESFLRQFNLSAADFRHMSNPPASTTDSSTLRPTDKQISAIKDLRFQDIRNKIENVYHGHMMNYNDLPTHEMAAYPTCAQINESTWTQDNNVTVRFAASLFETHRPYMYLDTAVLRLYKLNPHPDTRTTESPYDCDEQIIEPQIRVTISTIQHVRRGRREKKKKICNTMMLNRSQTGWVEIDIKKAINIWEKAERPNHNGNGNGNVNGNQNRVPVMVGWLTIEVHDEEDQPLRAGMYFEPPKCSEAFTAIPWNFYRISNPGASISMEKMSRSPRVDVKYLDFRSTAYGHHLMHNHNYHHSHHKSVYRHTNSGGGASSNINNNSPSVILQTTPTDNLLSSSELHLHRKRHEQNHHFHHSQHHSHNFHATTADRSQDSSSENPED